MLQMAFNIIISIFILLIVIELTKIGKDYITIIRLMKIYNVRINTKIKEKLGEKDVHNR